MRELFTPSIRYFGLSLFFSLAGNLCIMFPAEAINAVIEPALLKKAFDMYALLFLKFALYASMNKSWTSLWIRYSFLLLLITIVLSRYPRFVGIDFLPVTLYQGILAAALYYFIIMKWEARLIEKGAILIIVMLIGVSKTLFPYHTLPMYIIQLYPILSACIMFTLLMRVHQNLAKKEDTFDFLKKNAKDIIFDYRLKPVPYFAYISPSAETLTGYRQKEFYDDSNLFEELTVNEDRPSLRELFQATEPKALTVKWQKKDGDYSWIEFQNTPMYNEGEIYSIEGIIRDVTERKLIEEELIQSRKAKQLFFSHISHELKTPITSILGYAKAIESDVIEDPEKKKNAIELIISKSIILQRLTDDMLQLAKLESHQFSFQFTEVSVVDFFKNMVSKQKTAVETAGILFRYSVSDNLKENDLQIIIDIERMEQVFNNLVNNAIKFTPKGGEISVFGYLDSSNENVVFEVKDTGRGIPEKSLPFIFEAYYKAENVKDSEMQGSGLGLSIVKEIVRGHQGDIFAESKEGKSSTFIIVIPIYVQEDW